jgi:hypothetical protein
VAVRPRRRRQPAAPAEVAAIAYDEELAGRIRALAGDEGIAEKRMFGGLAFLAGGHMAVAASGQGGLLVRVDPDDAGDLLGEHVRPMEMRGRPMRGWLRVDAEAVATESALEPWVRRGLAYARSLPPK